MKKHLLPGEVGGDTTWFTRLNPFEKQETRRQVTFKRAAWPSLEDGVWSKRPTYQYPHILPAGHVEKAFYQPITQSVIGYLQEADIAVHSEILNLRSSQAACLNILFPLRLDLALAVTVLVPGPLPTSGYWDVFPLGSWLSWAWRASSVGDRSPSLRGQPFR